MNFQINFFFWNYFFNFFWYSIIGLVHWNIGLVCTFTIV